jgi:hypothetical protein
MCNNLPNFINTCGPNTGHQWVEYPIDNWKQTSNQCPLSRIMITKPIKSYLVKQLINDSIQSNLVIKQYQYVNYWNQSILWKMLQKLIFDFNSLINYINEFSPEQRILTINNSMYDNFSILVSDNFIAGILIMMEIIIQNLMYGQSLFRWICINSNESNESNESNIK